MVYGYNKDLSNLLDVKYYSKLDNEFDVKLALSFLKSETTDIDKKSDFDKQNWFFRYLTKMPTFLFKHVLDKKLKKGHDALLLYANEFVLLNEKTSLTLSKIDGFTLFHEHSRKYNNFFKGQLEDELHIYRMKRNYDKKGQGYGVFMAEAIIEYARSKKINYVRFGQNNEKMTRLLNVLDNNSDNLGIEVLNSYRNKTNFIRVKPVKS